MTNPDVRSVRLSGKERSVLRLAIMAYVDLCLDLIPASLLLESMEETAAQAQAALDAYTALYDDVVSQQGARDYVTAREGALTFAIKGWLAGNPDATIPPPGKGDVLLWTDLRHRLVGWWLYHATSAAMTQTAYPECHMMSGWTAFPPLHPTRTNQHQRRSQASEGIIQDHSVHQGSARGQDHRDANCGVPRRECMPAASGRDHDRTQGW